MIKSKIKNLIYLQLQMEFFKKENDIPDFSVSVPPPGIKSDYAINLPLVYARMKNIPINQVCEEMLPILSKIRELKNFSIAGGGFINFDVSDNLLCGCLLEVLKTSFQGEIYHLDENCSKKVLIEFVSSNPTGPLHIGHARCAAIGDSLARVYEALGYGRVVREYYVNDLGFQVKMLENSVMARIRELKGMPTDFPENGYKGEYIYDIARQAMETFGDDIARSDIARFAVEKMLESTKEDLKAFDVEMDNYFSESSLKLKTDELMKEFLDRHLAYEDEGALWFGSSTRVIDNNNPDDKDRVLRKRTGEYTYFATDIAYHKNKYERGFDEIINVWGADHHGYVGRIKAAISALGYDENKLKIILYQLVSLRRGKQKITMSTREGQFVTLKDVVDEVGKDAARFFLLMRAPGSGIDFDLDLAKKQTSENPVYYVQYAYARICSVFNQAKEDLTARTPQENFILSGGAQEDSKVSSENCDFDSIFSLLSKVLKTPQERELVKAILSFGDVLNLSKKDLSAHHITIYLIDVARKLHNFYEKCRVISPDNPDLSFARLALLTAVRKTIKKGLDIIGVSSPEKM